MTKVGLASIIISSYNYGQFLAEAIDSALNQTYANIEVIVVDDGSTDNSCEIIANYKNRIIPVLKENGGQASAFNAGFANSHGEIILFLDADDVLENTFIAEAQKFFVSDDIVKVHCPVWEADKFCKKTGGIIPKTPLPEGNCRDLLIASGPDAYINAPTHCNVFSRSFLERVFPMPEDFKNHAEIYPATLASIFGVIKAIPKPHNYYRMHGDNNYASQTAAEKNRRNLRLYDLRCLYLSKYLKETGDYIDLEVWKKGHHWYKWMKWLDVAADEIRHLIPLNEAFVLVDNDEWADRRAGSGVIEDRFAIPFLERDGQYWGPPLDDKTAISELERLRHQGAKFIVFAWNAFWWLEHYSALHHYLRSKYQCVLENDRLVIFAL